MSSILHPALTQSGSSRLGTELVPQSSLQVSDCACVYVCVLRLLLMTITWLSILTMVITHIILLVLLALLFSLSPPAVSLLSIEYLISGGNFQEFIKTFETLAQNPALWTSCKFMIALPFTYHCINGLRHLVRRRDLLLR